MSPALAASLAIIGVAAVIAVAALCRRPQPKPIHAPSDLDLDPRWDEDSAVFRIRRDHGGPDGGSEVESL